VRLLLDTHAFLWFSADDPTLSGRARASIENPGHEKFLSVASIWEIAIKRSLGKLELTAELGDLVQIGAEENGIGLLDLYATHALGVGALPFHHRDPFDRMLISQALAEGMAIVGRDAIFDDYAVRRIW
jgi:PIN domain nuclease of toxin-antitoxin system